MSWESNAPDEPEVVKDRTKLVWGIVLVGVVLMAALLAFTTRETKSGVSRAYVKHIYVSFQFRNAEERDRALELIGDVRSRIVSGDLTFEEAARQYSAEAVSAQRGGVLGWTERDDFAEGKAKEFVWNGPVGELSPILESRNGFHLILVEKRELSARDQYELEIQERVLNRDADPE